MTSLVLRNIITENEKRQNCYEIAVKFYFTVFNENQLFFFIFYFHIYIDFVWNCFAREIISMPIIKLSNIK